MIYISKPYIEERGNEIFLVSIVKDESRNLQTELWYSVEKQYGSIFVTIMLIVFFLLSWLLQCIPSKI